MYCSQCATELAPDDVFCPACSKPVASFAFDSTNAAQVEPLFETPTVIRPARAPKKAKVWKWAAGLSTALLLIGGGILIGGLAIATYVLFINPNSKRADVPANNDRVNTAKPESKTPSVEPSMTATPQDLEAATIAKNLRSKDCWVTSPGAGGAYFHQHCDVLNCSKGEGVGDGILMLNGTPVNLDGVHVKSGKNRFYRVTFTGNHFLWIGEPNLHCE